MKKEEIKIIREIALIDFKTFEGFNLKTISLIRPFIKDD